jgi:hypothetical protein
VLYNNIVGNDPFGLSVSFFSQDWNNTVVGEEAEEIQDYCWSTNNTSLEICTFFKQFPKHEINWVNQ